MSQASEEKFRLLAENSCDIIWIVDTALQSSYVSASVLPLTGYTVDEWMTLPFAEKIPHEDRPAVLASMKSLLARAAADPSFRSVHLEIPFLRKDGSRMMGDVSAAVIRDASGIVSSIQGITRDMTERYKNTEALRRSEAMYRLLAENTSDVIWIEGTDQRLRYVSPSIERMTGYSVAEWMAMPLSLRVSIDEMADEGSIIAAGVIHAKADPSFNTLRCEIPMRRKDGTVLRCDVSVSFIRDDNDDVIAVQGISRDITEQKRAEEALVESEEKLRQAQKMEVIGQLAGGIAHDFNNMLAGIIGAAELLDDKLLDPRLKQLSSTILEAGTRAADLVAKLLAFSRKGKFLSEQVDMHHVIDEVIALLSRSIDRRISIVRRYNAPAAVAPGDMTLLQNALLNLALNARDAMPDGGTLTFTTSTVELDEAFCRASLFTARPGVFIELDVSDTGTGMSEEVKRHLFEPFFTTKGQGKGTGLGLSAVYGAIKDHGGIVLVDSAPGQGSTFRMYLPMLDAAPLAQPAVEMVAEHGTGRILVVDDEAVVRNMAGALLRELGYEVIDASDGLEALERYDQEGERIDLVLLDVVMPQMSGLDVFRRLRTINPKVRVLFTSGFLQDQSIDDMVQQGARGFVQKPYRMTELGRSIADALRAGL